MIRLAKHNLVLSRTRSNQASYHGWLALQNDYHSNLYLARMLLRPYQLVHGHRHCSMAIGIGYTKLCRTWCFCYFGPPRSLACYEKKNFVRHNTLATLDLQDLSPESFQNHTKMISKRVVLKMLFCLLTFGLKIDFHKWSEISKTWKNFELALSIFL